MEVIMERQPWSADPGGSSSSPPHTMATSQKTALERLPTEILGEVLSNLPARDLCRVRQVNKFLRGFFHENRAAILQPAIHRNIARIAAHHDALANVAHLDFYQAVERYYRCYRPNPATVLAHGPEARQGFCYNWVRKRYPNLNVPEAKRIAQALIQIMNRTETGDISLKEANNHVVPLVDDFFHFGYPYESRLAWLDIINRLPLIDRFTLPQFPQPYGLSFFQLTTRITDDGTIAGRYENIWHWLGLPELGQGNIHFFTYCLNDAGINRMLKDVRYDHGLRLPMLKRAAILEVIFIW